MTSPGVPGVPVVRILVTGSRDWPDNGTVEATLTTLVAGFRPTIPIVVVHGDCPTGADAYASRWVAHQPSRISEEPHPADWTQGRKAGPRRNARMVEAGAHLTVAFIGPCTSPRCHRPDPHDSHGATGCARLAEEAGIPVRRIRPTPTTP